MAASHYNFTSTSQAASDLRDCLRNLALAWDKYSRQRGVLVEKKDLAASGNAQYAALTTDYGYPTDAIAAASFAELDSAFGTANAAISQCLNRHL